MSAKSGIVPERAANVRIQQPCGLKRRSTQKAISGFATQLPTPVASSQPEPRTSKGDSAQHTVIVLLLALNIFRKGFTSGDYHFTL